MSSLRCFSAVMASRLIQISEVVGGSAIATVHAFTPTIAYVDGPPPTHTIVSSDCRAFKLGNLVEINGFFSFSISSLNNGGVLKAILVKNLPFVGTSASYGFAAFRGFSDTACVYLPSAQGIMLQRNTNFIQQMLSLTTSDIQLNTNNNVCFSIKIVTA